MIEPHGYPELTPEGIEEIIRAIQVDAEATGDDLIDEDGLDVTNDIREGLTHAMRGETYPVAWLWQIIFDYDGLYIED